MAKTKNSAKIITLILMMLSLNTIYVLPYLMYTYYTPLQEAMHLVGQDAAYGKLLNIRNRKRDFISAGRVDCG